MVCSVVQPGESIVAVTSLLCICNSVNVVSNTYYVVCSCFPSILLYFLIERYKNLWQNTPEASYCRYYSVVCVIDHCE